MVMDTNLTTSTITENLPPEEEEFDIGFFIRELAKQRAPQFADEKTIAQLDELEAEGKGVWATVREYAKAIRQTRQAVYKKLKKYILKKDIKSNKILIWVPEGITQKRIEAVRASHRSWSIIEAELRIPLREAYKVKNNLEGSAENESIIIHKKIPVTILHKLINRETEAQG